MAYLIFVNNVTFTIFYKIFAKQCKTDIEQFYIYSSKHFSYYKYFKLISLDGRRLGIATIQSCFEPKNYYFCKSLKTG